MQVIKEVMSKVMVYRFDVFKGKVDDNGKVEKVKSVGTAYLREGLHTYTVHLKTFLNDSFYLLQNTKSDGPDFVILTREPAQNINRKYFWNSVGGASVLDGENAGIMKLNFDLFGEDIYMKVNPISQNEVPHSDENPSQDSSQAA